MQITTKNLFTSRNFINFLLVLLPISFIAGNLIINLNAILLIFTTFFFYKYENLKLNINFVDKLLVVFFIFSFLTGVVNFFLSADQNNVFVEENFYKSIFFLRYLFLYFSLRIIIENELFNYKIFFIICSLCALFVSFDLIIQLIFGADVFGYPKTPYKLSGPFGSEQIAGTYLQRFGIFLFFLLPFVLKLENKNKLIIALSAIFMLFFFSMLIAANRMPILLFLLMFILLFIYEKKLRKFTLLFVVSFCFLFLIILNFSPQIQDYSQYFLRMVLQMIAFLNEILIEGKEPNITNIYIKEFYTGYITWKENFLIGGGINSFYLNCSKTISYCASHPHNYYLEILSELGIVGFCLFIMIIIKICLMINFRRSLSMNFDNNLIFPFVLLFFAEIFPLKTSGSFFTTGSATFIFFIMAIIVSLSKKHSN
tara:strand:- start:790 stop:2067 length:1278 start_codon:yes stop_codon:yes gene_type:complete